VNCASRDARTVGAGALEQIVEQIIRPTGSWTRRSRSGRREPQIDLSTRFAVRVEHGEQVLLTTLTIKMAEDLTDYLPGAQRQARMHANIETLDRIQIIRGLRTGEFERARPCFWRALTCRRSRSSILDADKEGFLRGGARPDPDDRPRRPQRQGRVIMYADRMTDSMKAAIGRQGAAGRSDSLQQAPWDQAEDDQQGVSDILIAAEAKASTGLTGAAARPADPEELRTSSPTSRPR